MHTNAVLAPMSVVLAALQARGLFGHRLLVCNQRDAEASRTGAPIEYSPPRPPVCPV